VINFLGLVLLRPTIAKKGKELEYMSTEITDSNDNVKQPWQFGKDFQLRMIKELLVELPNRCDSLRLHSKFILHEKRRK
jgi:hypothetical protein